MTIQKTPWRNAVVYQIYPWTFNEDETREPQRGHGSIKGITEKLPYLKHDLGVDALWLSPFYPSPMKDGGYDISNFTDVHPDLGTLQDFDELVRASHEMGIRLMVDFIPNHSSDQHEWFQKSRHREEGYEDWYIWHPGIVDDEGNRQPPNNWPCVFSIPQKVARSRGEMPWLHEGEWTPPLSAWHWDDVRGEFYMHSFAVEQPDLNWHNPEVREAMKQAMHFWLDRGVDGFRVDAVNHIGKDMRLLDEEVNTAYNEGWENPYDQLLKHYSCNYPETLHAYIWEMCQVLKDEKYRERELRMVLEAYMGEADLRDIDAIEPSVAESFNFGTFSIDWEAKYHKIQLDYYYERLQKHGVGNQVNGNHDKPRLANRLGEDNARSAAILNLFLPGMRFVYNGEELGLHNAEIPLERMQDPNGLRDPERTPMVWDDALPNAGFSRADPNDLWLPTNPADAHLAVAHQVHDLTSSLMMYKSAIQLTHELPATKTGKYQPLHSSNEAVLAYGRVADDSVLIVLTNFTGEEQHVVVPDSNFVVGKSALSSVTIHQRKVDLRAGVILRPYEALVVIPA